MLVNERKLERGIIVFCNWAVFGIIGLTFLLEGVATDAYLTALAGIIGIVAGFIGHMVINVVFGQAFSLGETALGLAVFAISILIFILNWAFVGLSETDFFIGLTLLSVLVTGFFAYLSTRYGIRGAFNRFDVKSQRRSRQKG